MDLRGLLHHLGVKTGGFTQGGQLAVIAGAQRFGGEDEVFPGEVPLVDLTFLCLRVMGGQGHHDLFVQ